MKPLHSVIAVFILISQLGVCGSLECYTCQWWATPSASEAHEPACLTERDLNQATGLLRTCANGENICLTRKYVSNTNDVQLLFRGCSSSCTAFSPYVAECCTESGCVPSDMSPITIQASDATTPLVATTPRAVSAAPGTTPTVVPAAPGTTPTVVPAAPGTTPRNVPEPPATTPPNVPAPPATTPPIVPAPPATTPRVVAPAPATTPPPAPPQTPSTPQNIPPQTATTPQAVSPLALTTPQNVPEQMATTPPPPPPAGPSTPLITRSDVNTPFVTPEDRTPTTAQAGAAATRRSASQTTPSTVIMNPRTASGPTPTYAAADHTTVEPRRGVTSTDGAINATPGVTPTGSGETSPPPWNQPDTTPNAATPGSTPVGAQTPTSNIDGANFVTNPARTGAADTQTTPRRPDSQTTPSTVIVNPRTASGPTPTYAAADRTTVEINVTPGVTPTGSGETSPPSWNQPDTTPNAATPGSTPVGAPTPTSNIDGANSVTNLDSRTQQFTTPSTVRVVDVTGTQVTPPVTQTDEFLECYVCAWYRTPPAGATVSSTDCRNDAAVRGDASLRQRCPTGNDRCQLQLTYLGTGELSGFVRLCTTQQSCSSGPSSFGATCCANHGCNLDSSMARRASVMGGDINHATRTLMTSSAFMLTLLAIAYGVCFH